MTANKPRVLGLLTLVMITAIFFPMLFDGAGLKESKLDLDIPKPPDFPVMQIAEPQKQRLADTRQVAEPRPQNAELKQPRMTPSPVASPPVSMDRDKPVAAAAQAPSQRRPAAPELSVEKEMPVLDTQGVPVAWTLQLAAFKQHDNAESLKLKLQKAGFKAYIRQKNDLSVVFVGPDIQRTELEKIQQQLSNDLKLNGLILRFTTS